MSSAPDPVYGELSLFEQISLLPDAERNKILLELTDEDLSSAHLWLRPKQLRAVSSESWITFVQAGRGYGKTRVGAHWIIEKARVPGTRIALLGRTVSDVRDVMVSGQSGILACSAESFMPEYQPSLRRLVWPNGSTAQTYCATPDTKAMSRARGWVTHEQLEAGDEVLTLNTVTGKSEWQPVKAMHRFDVVDEPMIAVDMNYHSSCTTLGHRWPMVNKSTGKIVMRDSLLEANTKEAFITGADCADLPHDPVFTDSFVELVGWYTTEGHIKINERADVLRCTDRKAFVAFARERRKFLGRSWEELAERVGYTNDELMSAIRGGGGDEETRQAIAKALGVARSTIDEHFQAVENRAIGVLSQMESSPYIGEIRAALEAEWGPERSTLKDVREPAWRGSTDQRGKTNFILTHEAVASLAVAAPGFEKVVTHEFINALTKSQLEIFVTAVMNGDGTWRDNGAVIAQKIEARLDAIELACVLLGWSTKRQDIYSLLHASKSPRRVKPGGAGRILVDNFLLASSTTPRPVHPNGSFKDQRQLTWFTGTVWCPETENGTWLASRNGSVYFTGNSSESPGQLRGPQQHIAWVDELAACKQVPDNSGLTAWDNLQIATRLGDKPQILVTTTPKRTQVIRSLVKESREDPDRVLLISGSTLENKANLSRDYIQQIYDRYAGTALEKQELHGEFVDEVEGALWRESDFVDAPLPIDHELSCLAIVSVDPGVTTGGDATGIVVVKTTLERRLDKRRIWVVEDATMEGPPEAWSKKVIEMQAKWSTPSHKSIIVAEKNQGGELIRAVLTQIDPSIRLALISAVKSKAARADPVVLAYRQGRVFHSAMLDDLEQEQLDWEEDAKWSPNRMDALVHGVRSSIVDPRPLARFSPLIVGELSGSVILSTGSPSHRPGRGSSISTAPWRQGQSSPFGRR